MGNCIGCDSIQPVVFVTRNDHGFHGEDEARVSGMLRCGLMRFHVLQRRPGEWVIRPIQFRELIRRSNTQTDVMILRAIFFIVGTLILAGVAISAGAQQITIPDPALDAAIRDALHKPIGPLTQQDLLTLTNSTTGPQ